MKNEITHCTGRVSVNAMNMYMYIYIYNVQQRDRGIEAPPPGVLRCSRESSKYDRHIIRIGTLYIHVTRIGIH